MTVTLPCSRCATEIHLVGLPTADAALDVRVMPHSCYRFLVGECWHDGEMISCWTSDRPGRTGPDDLVLYHGKEADEGWHPPAGNGWTYRWQIDEAVVFRADA